VVSPQERSTGESKLGLLPGTLDVMVMQTLETVGAHHGYGIARRIEQVSGEEVLLNQGTIHASLVRLQQRGWIAAKWRTSDNNRRAKFYSITKLAQRSKLVNKADSREELRVPSDTFLDTGHAYEDHAEAALIEDGALLQAVHCQTIRFIDDDQGRGVRDRFKPCLVFVEGVVSAFIRCAAAPCE
jgi:DNA-binding PadR family transcriptional regulator